MIYTTATSFKPTIDSKHGKKDWTCEISLISESYIFIGVQITDL